MTSYGKFDEYVRIAISDSEKASEVVAKSFYKILRKNGFNNNQIISVANNILDCLIQTLVTYKERTGEAAGAPESLAPGHAQTALIGANVSHSMGGARHSPSQRNHRKVRTRRYERANAG